jgi:hypothetical protein
MEDPGSMMAQLLSQGRALKFLSMYSTTNYSSTSAALGSYKSAVPVTLLSLYCSCPCDLGFLSPMHFTDQHGRLGCA